MENNKNLEVNVVIEVIAKDYRNGLAVSAVEADAKLKTVFGGREKQRDEQSIMLLGTTCGGVPRIEADYNSAEIGEGTLETKVQFDLKGKTIERESGELVDGFSANGKIHTLKENMSSDKVVQDWFKLKATKDCGASCATVESFYTTKTNDI